VRSPCAPFTKSEESVPDAVLVSDFDGTMTANDFYKLAVQRLLSPEDLAPWREYLAGKRTHFAALQEIFGSLRATEAQLLELVRDMAPDPGLADSVARLRTAGWRVVVASAGCGWYIRRILASLGLDAQVEVHANPGELEPGGALRMTLPAASPFTCLETGVDKAAIVRGHQTAGSTVAFAGDGFADLPAALQVRPELRFARADLAQALRERGEGFQTFSRWSEVAQALLSRGAAA
jgi:2-hydroxy-3-keto-5-methylthiopentenyl-1-phosphate phosphatase